ncbi:MAG TPA: hypothetical protein VM661_17935 [Candidatus Sulfotelmatobacter sp.]|nr:hypothetical protein [Candidatus Sulfotelmatobacter sp.]
MTIARINTVAFQGIDVQAQVAAGLPAFTIVGPIAAYGFTLHYELSPQENIGDM